MFAQSSPSHTRLLYIGIQCRSMYETVFARASNDIVVVIRTLLYSGYMCVCMHIPTYAIYRKWVINIHTYIRDSQLANGMASIHVYINTC